MNKASKELLDKAIKIDHKTEKLPLFKGIYIIQQTKLHDSGYRMMYIIGNTDYDKNGDCEYYLISKCADVIEFKPLFDNMANNSWSMADLHLDIDENGIIHIWTRENKRKWIRSRYGICFDTCYLEIVED